MKEAFKAKNVKENQIKQQDGFVSINSFKEYIHLHIPFIMISTNYTIKIKMIY
ncbi:hypothetical protein Q5W90_05835 [Borreliella burgdorferi]|uniref:hypothetical protein n=1 Tax=Borreliella burgdorferi TaxID=139 RepID=UPI0003275609|nr:hypothetical protein [Borreliella burgdorferi]EOA79940.1 hypothetical protein BBUCA8_04237 [Borreliella burgdorferi CA8]MDO7257014.1 hypothetical protein [Borreliella burgdorferi]MDO7279688.1 hypothetical protein [Borreliella burgdorferi]